MKLLPYTLPFLLLITSFSFAQGSKFKEPIDISFGFHIAGESNSVSYDKMNPNFSLDKKPGFEVGGSLLLRLSKRFMINSGVGFSTKQYTFTEKGFVLGTDIDPILGVVSHSKLETKVKYSEIYVPVSVQYYFVENTFFLSLGGGAHYQLMDKTERTMISENGITEKLNDSPSTGMNYSFRAGLGYYMYWGRKSAILLEPFVKSYLKDNTIPDTKLVNYGVELSFYF